MPVPDPIRKVIGNPTLQVILTVLLVFGILVDLNFIFARHHFRIDMTENEEFTLSDASKSILANIKDLVTLKVYLTQDPVAQALKIKRRIEDTVTEFEAAAKGKLRVDFIDPKDDEKEKEDAERYGVVPVQVQSVEDDRAEMVNTYLGIAILYEDKDEVIPMILETSNLEYELISRIKKLTLFGDKALPEVAFLGGHGEPAIGTIKIPFGEYSQIAAQLRQIAHVSTVNPSLPNDKHVDPEKYSVLVVAAPKGIDDRSLYAIDQFIMNGGSVIFLLDPNEVDQQRFSVTVNDSGLDEMLAHYGVRTSNELILDLSGRRRQILVGRTKRGQPIYGFAEYPFVLYPSAGLGRLSMKNAVTSRIDQMILLWASPVEPMAETLPGREVMPLIWTSKKSWTASDLKEIRPKMEQDLPQPASEADLAERTLALAIQGKFTSFFQGKEIPPLLNRATQEPIEDDPLAVPLTETKKETQIIVVGDHDFLKNGILQNAPGNAAFLQNAVDWMALNPDLVGIRAKGDISRPIDTELSKGRKNTFKFLNMFGVPAIVALLGFLRLLQRRLVRRRYFRRLASEETRELKLSDVT